MHVLKPDNVKRIAIYSIIYPSYVLLWQQSTLLNAAWVWGGMFACSIAVLVLFELAVKAVFSKKSVDEPENQDVD